jgi:hypothetical protein
VTGVAAHSESRYNSLDSPRARLPIIAVRLAPECVSQAEGNAQLASDIIYGVFVSSTYDDLREERAEVQKALLKLHCFPIGMEIFGSADEETWEFIKRQVAECDYYVVIIADRYGSTASDGLSYTEKEYDYARQMKKPVLAFLHSSRGSLPRDKTESDPDKRPKLEAFIQKVSQSPVSYFTTQHELAAQVIVSFVNQRDRTPAVGFIRADQVSDPTKYAALLEENSRLRTELLTVSEESKIEVSSDPQRGCIVRVPIQAVDAAGNVVRRSQATSVRVWVQATGKVAPHNVTAFLTRIERRTADGAWEESSNHEIVPLTWTDTNTTLTDVSNLFPKFVNVLHINQGDTSIGMYGTLMPLSLPEFFRSLTTYRLTVSVMAAGITKQTTFEIDWKGQWDTIEMRPEERLRDHLLSRAVLEVRLEQCEPYLRRHENLIYWRFALHNRGSAVADNVHVSLAAIRPLPPSAVGLLDFPLGIPVVDRINPNESGICQIFTAYPDTQGGQPSTRWRADALGHGLNYRPSVFFENGGQWEMDYQISAANADDFEFTLVVHAKSDCIIVTRKP